MSVIRPTVRSGSALIACGPPGGGSERSQAERLGPSDDDVEELDHGVVEQVVAVAGHHVAGTGDVDQLRVGHQLEQLRAPSSLSRSLTRRAPAASGP